ncbi:T complex testis-specific protein, putative [Pediculus humanus corporis]|uniref:T complex testis-specific protein, putative n=1 Tax=Pediculus humanus subsp. corporis TaxID=121224 RepID=E0VDA6_PEDHC|nr:T complex testis-specific protein, putative [Pediculus humanus corporis]EEB11362.1 T complex testis-specific protein, putative [Pediculus humanus corporis]
MMSKEENLKIDDIKEEVRELKDDHKDPKLSLSYDKKKYANSKSIVNSKSSLKSADSSNTSSSSLAMKRQSEYDRLAKGPKYQNTYRLDSKKPFKSNEVYNILKNVVKREISNFLIYDSLMGPRIVQTIAADVRSLVKAMSYDRYKICVMVYLGEKKLQGFQAAFRGLWDHERDGWSTYYYQTRTYFVSCTCFGLYHD